MKWSHLRNTALAALILASGCAFNQLQGRDGPVRAELPQPGVPETLLEDVRLAPHREVQDLLDSSGRIGRYVAQLVKDTEGRVSGMKRSPITVRALKERGMFRATVLAGETLVVFVDVEGSFTDTAQVGGGTRTMNYSRMTAIFDPADGEMLGYGLLP